MKTFQTSSARMVAVELPEGTTDYQVHEGDILTYWEPNDWTVKQRLPSGSWEILGMADQIVPVKAAEIMGVDVRWGKPALASLLTSNGVEGAHNLILIESKTQ